MAASVEHGRAYKSNCHRRERKLFLNHIDKSINGLECFAGIREIADWAPTRYNPSMHFHLADRTRHLRSARASFRGAPR
jgi:hypothetical protein